MYNFIKKIPLPFSGVMLSLAALGNLLSSYNLMLKNFLGVLSALILILITAKLLIFNKSLKEDFNNPVIASVMPTYSMGIMLLSVYLKTFAFNVAFTLWIIGFCIHLLLIVFYSKKFLFQFNIKKLFPSTFVVYVGIGVAGITAPTFNLTTLGQGVFWFTFIAFLILLPILIYRTLIIKAIPEPALPTIAIFSAPASLCLAAYLNSFKEKNIYIFGFLCALSLLLYLVVLLKLPKLLKLKFSPSFAAFTFPMVISGIALKTSNAFLKSLQIDISFLKYIVNAQEVIALVIVTYVLIKYIEFIFKKASMKVNTTISK